MIVRYLPNGCRKVFNLLPPFRTLSAIPGKSLDDIKEYPALAEIFSSENQLAKLQGTPIIEEPASLLDHIPSVYQHMLDMVQVSSGIPWWGVLAGLGIAVRLGTLPAHVQMEKSIMHRLPLIRIEKEAILATLTGDFVLSVKKTKEAQEYSKQHRIRSSVTLVKYFIPGCILFLLNYSAISGLSSMNYSPVMDTSFLWMPSLCLSDPNRIVSFVNGIMVAVIARRFILNSPDPQKSHRITSHIGKWSLFGFIAIAAQASLPASILLYWTASNATSVFLNDQLLRADWFRTKVGLTTFAEKVRAFETIPQAKPKQSAIQIFGKQGEENAVVNPTAVREKELTRLWEEGDLGVLKSSIEEQRSEESDVSETLEQDMQFCEEELRNLSTAEKLSSPIRSQLAAHKRVIENKMNDAKKRGTRLEMMERKLVIAERKQKFEFLLTSEKDREFEQQKMYLQETHTKLLVELEACETELYEDLNSKRLQHFERYANKQELLQLQRRILDDVDFCEKEILSLPSVKNQINSDCE